MKRHLITLSSILIIWSCGSNDNEGSNSSDNAKPIQIEKKADPDDPISNKGIGPVTSMDLARTFILLKLDLSALMGYTGAVFQKFFGTSLGYVLSLSIGCFWILIPTGLSLYFGNKKDF